MLLLMYHFYVNRLVGYFLFEMGFRAAQTGLELTM